MAVQNIVRPVNPVEAKEPGKMAALTRVITWGIYGLGLVLVCTIVALLVTSQVDKQQTEGLREAWDEVYLAWKDKKKEIANMSDGEQIAIWESLWDDKKISGTRVQPYVAMQLAELHFKMGLKPQLRPKERNEALKRAELVYKTVREHEVWNKIPIYGAFAVEGEALALEQQGKWDEAIALLTDSVGSYEQHFLFEKLCYQLGRCLWLRAQKCEAKGEDAVADRQKALRRLNQAVRESGEDDKFMFGWKDEAKFLKGLLQKPGPAMPSKLPPPPEPKKTDKEKKTDAEKRDKADTGSVNKDADAPSEAKKTDAPTDAAAGGETKDAETKAAAEVRKGGFKEEDAAKKDADSAPAPAKAPAKE